MYSTCTTQDPFFNSTLPARANSSLRQTSFVGMVSECPEMKKIFSIVEKVARTSATVLVLGESGTGKELIARALHKLSGRSGRLVPINCAAIPEEILESEMFGHERGAFTGAMSARIGRFQMADGGTIFLDEIGEMSPKLQVKLLRVLQERKVDPVGSNRSIDIDVRIVAATNKDLRQEVKAGRFREDLFYRLQVVPIELVPLRARGADLGLLAQFFLQRASANLGCATPIIAPRALELLESYNWPGNIRELENLIERLTIFCEHGQIKAEHLPDYIFTGNVLATPSNQSFSSEIPLDGLDFNALVDQFESNLIRSALQRTHGNKKAAARLLKLNRTTLVEKIKKKGLEASIECEIDSHEEDARDILSA